MALRNYQDLIAWQKAMDLVEAVYRLSRMFPKDEIYVLTTQVRRAAISIPSNIAEGQGRGSDPGFAYFLRIAYGSIRELETQILLSMRLGYAAEEEARTVLDLSAEVGRLLNGLMNSLQ